MSTLLLMGLIAAVIVVVLLLHRLARFVWRLLVRVARGMSPHLRDWGELAHAHPLRAALAARWPRLYEAMVRRSSPHKFSGLPLTLITIFLWLTALGSSPAIVAVGVVATGFLWAHRRAFFVAPLWITFSAHRRRPGPARC